MVQPVLQDDAFLADVAAARVDVGDGFRLWWLGQSGFLVQWAEPSEPYVDPPRLEPRHLLIDPYLSDSLTAKYAATNKPHVRISERVVDPARLDFVDVVTSSHNHTDHLDAATLGPLLRVNPGLEVVHPAANGAVVAERLGVAADANGMSGLEVGRTVRTSGPAVTAVPAAHDRFDLDEQGRHPYVGYVFGLDRRFAIYHSGDTVVYDGLADRLRALGPIDVAILPINGKVGNMGGRDAARLAKDVGARLVIPCHYDMFAFNTADPHDEFVPKCERLGQPYRVLKLGERFSSSEIPRP